MEISKKVAPTPGPWRIEKRLGSLMVRGQDIDVIAIALPDCEPSEANARLIAAAPELLRGCEAALAYLADPPSIYPENRAAAVEIIRTAIAKAEGRGGSAASN